LEGSFNGEVHHGASSSKMCLCPIVGLIDGPKPSLDTSPKRKNEHDKNLARKDKFLKKQVSFFEKQCTHSRVAKTEEFENQTLLSEKLIKLK
jgi:hypothetical protein